MTTIQPIGGQPVEVPGTEPLYEPEPEPAPRPYTNAEMWIDIAGHLQGIALAIWRHYGGPPQPDDRADTEQAR